VDISVIFYAVVALVSVGGGWLIASYQHAQQKAEQLAEREEIVAELSAAKQQIAQSAHWRDECELLNNELRNLRDINTSLEADLREVTTRLESTRCQEGMSLASAPNQAAHAPPLHKSRHLMANFGCQLRFKAALRQQLSLFIVDMA
jgi:hypothetical protein